MDELEALQLQALAHAHANPIAAADAATAQQTEQDNALIAQKPIGARLIKAAQGIPWIGEHLDELRGAIRGPEEGAKLSGMEDAMDRQHPGQSAALGLTGGVLGTIAASPILPETAAGLGLYSLLEGTTSEYGRSHDPEQAAASGLFSGALGYGTSKVAGALLKRIGLNRAAGKVPSADALKAEAGNLYETGKSVGQTASGKYTSRLATELQQTASDNGLISPSGQLAPGYDKISHALRMAKDYASSKMNPTQMREVRTAIQAAAQSNDANEARIGTKMLRSFDDWVDPLVPQFREANGIYARGMRGEEINNAIATAATRKQGAEAALSNEFGGLQRKAIRGDMTMPDELAAAVEKVGQSKGAQGVFAAGGKAAPSGVVSMGLGGGLPFLIGNSIGGPGLGMALSGGTMAGGTISKIIANQVAKGNAGVASAVARNGAPLVPEEVLPENIKQLIAALIARQAGQQAQ